MPLLHLDFGALFNRFHGESERNLRESLSAAELMAPCVLWIDEIEKGLSTSESDGGTSRRMLGTLLTWMAERKARVFLAATANDITSLPPELVRKGRFDEIFFVDLPDEATRAEVMAIHLARRGQKPELSRPRPWPRPPRAFPALNSNTWWSVRSTWPTPKASA